ncbi:MAG: hypothetical protein EBT85_03050 [Synechococcaceae bacterium WB5_2B_268]|nr:hypothetical protein [Synechococcaceae bacterium WB5_2B_268]
MLPKRIRLKLIHGSYKNVIEVASSLGGHWHGASRSLIVLNPPTLSQVSANLYNQGWWLQAPHPLLVANPKTNPWEQIGLEIGASLIGASVGGALGQSFGFFIAGPPGAATGSFLGLVIGAVAATESLDNFQRKSDLNTELNSAKTRVSSRGGLIAGPLGASTGALIGTLLLGQIGEDAALHRSEQWRNPLQWLTQTGRSAAGEAASQNLFGLLGGAILQNPGRKAGEKLGLYLGRRINWQNLKPLTN